jgi:hypothetical protein
MGKISALPAKKGSHLREVIFANGLPFLLISFEISLHIFQ